MFDNFLVAVGGGSFSAARKEAILLTCLGAEGQRIFESLPAAVKQEGEDQYAFTRRRLEAQFAPRQNVCVERYRFRSRVQQTEETVQQWVSILRQLASSCEYGDRTDEFIRDQVIERTNSSKLRQRLLMEGSDLTLERTLTISDTLESAEPGVRIDRERIRPLLEAAEPRDEKSLRAFLGAVGSERNGVADGLSRLPVAETWWPDDDSIQIAALSLAAAVTEEELRDASASDECLDVIRGYLAGRWPRQRDVDPRATGFYQVRDELSQLGPLLFRGERLVVPAALRERVLRNAHEGHQGETRTKQRLRAQFWWPRLDKEVRDLLRSCEVCTQHDGHVRQERPPLQPIPLPDGPWQRLMVDVIGPMQGPQHERYGIVLCDMFSSAHPLLGTQKSCSQPLSNPKVYRPGG
ncbi:uncharacterized protein FJT64_014051 [Amphibalanus amphitrite]|uniref:RNA-directed DNA polymerase n=1 Tax=Amphibalanus amphitrite TaxID=1232801 RepID=A0A6A4V0Q8_AMPAM|nr:uncharacterized protein FJT64_014051 [Amphibalanus amphitrite]